MVERPGEDVSVRRQCALLNLARSGVYRPKPVIGAGDLALMRRIDELHLELPFYGSRRMTFELNKEGRGVNRKRVQRLMRVMGIEALVPRPGTSKPSPGHKIYPYLLRGLAIAEPNHVWAADITYIPMARGFLYLVAIIDWASRAVLAWRLRKDELAHRRNDYEDACLVRLSQVLPPGGAVTILADRGFGDRELFAFLGELGFGYVTRGTPRDPRRRPHSDPRSGALPRAQAAGETRPVAEWVGKAGRARKLRDAKVTATQGCQVGAVVCVHAKAMKEPWCLAASDAGKLKSDQPRRPQQHCSQSIGCSLTY
jgi:hypothetical protein